MSLQLLTRHSVDDHALALADYYPLGHAFSQTHSSDSVFYGLIKGLAFENQRVEQTINNFAAEYDFRATTALLSEWESAVGIPDKCFSTNASLEARRQQIHAKWFADGVSTKEQMERVGQILGADIEIIAGADSGLSFPTDKEMRNTIVIRFLSGGSARFTLEFTYVFGGSLIVLLECFYRQIVPATTQLIFEEV